MSTATAATSETQTKRLFDLAFIIKASRPGLWATAVWFYLLPPGRLHVFHSARFWLGLIYVTLPLGLIIYGWNDVADIETDRFNPRKGTFLFGARGSREQLAKLPAQIALVQAVFLGIFWYLEGPKILLWFAALVAITAIYNFPRYGLKSQPPFDILNQVGYLLVFVLSAWLNHAPQLRSPAMLFGALFAMHSHVFGEIMDIEPDRLSGRPTIRNRRIPAEKVARIAETQTGRQSLESDYKLTHRQIADAVKWYEAVSRFETAA